MQSFLRKTVDLEHFRIFELDFHFPKFLSRISWQLVHTYFKHNDIQFNVMYVMIIDQIRTILIDQCSASCGGGFRRKTRECVNNEISRLGRQLVFDNPCKQALDVVEECNKQLCPEWTEWGEWTTCSKSCSGGRRRKFRQCVDRVSGGHRSDTPYFFILCQTWKVQPSYFPHFR